MSKTCTKFPMPSHRSLRAGWATVRLISFFPQASPEISIIPEEKRCFVSQKTGYVPNVLHVIYVMSSSELYLCIYCNRSDFKSRYGLTQHQKFGSCHAAMVQELRDRTGASEPNNLRARPPQNAGQEGEEMEESTQESEGMEQGEETDSEGGNAVVFDGSSPDSEDDGSVSSDQSSMPSLSSSASSTSSEGSHDRPPGEEEDDDDEDEDDLPIPQEIEIGDGEGPITSIRDQFREYCDAHPSTFRRCLTDAEVASLSLLDIMFKKKAPLNAHKDLMKWHLEASGELGEGQDLQNCRGYKSREVTMKEMRSRYNMDNKYPHQKKVKLPISGEIVRLTLHEPGSVLQALLTDPRIQDSDYCFHGDNPLAPPPEKQRTIRDLNTGKAHRSTHHQIIDEDPLKREQSLGLIIYMDGSAITHFKDFEVTQVKVSLGIFTREARLKGYTWRTLGYVEKVHQSGGAGRDIWEQSQHMETEGVRPGADDGSSVAVELDGIGKENLQDLHAQVRAILEPLDPLFEKGFLWDLRYKNVLYRDIHYKLYVAMVRCDNKEANSLCGRYGQLSTCKQLCRFCHVLTTESDDHLHVPKYKTEPQIKRLINRIDKDGLKEISQHYLLNAFHNVPFHRANTRGIHGACPVDMLHTVLLGIFKYVRDVFFQYVGATSIPAKQINGLSKEYAKCFSRQSDRSMPPMRFSKGIQEGKLMGKEYRGVILLLLVIVRSKAGGSIIKRSRKGKFRSKEAVSDWALLLEMWLLLEAYLNVPEMEVKDLRLLEKGIRYIMYLTRMVAQREQGVGYKILKFHGLLHIVDNVILYGVPLECDTSANESHHKPTKQAANLTQKRHSTFNIQTSTRLVDFEIIDFARWEMDGGRVPWDYYRGAKEEIHRQEAPNSEESSDGDSSKSDQVVTETRDAMIRVHLNDITNEVEFTMVTRSKFKGKTKLHPQLLEFLWDLQDLLHVELGNQPLEIHTRIVRAGTSFRGHPNYRGKGPWRDWAWFNFGRDGTFPCQIHCFVVIPSILGGKRLNFGGIRLHEGVFAVVECGKILNDSDELLDMDILSPLEKEVGLDEEGNIRLDESGKVQERRFYLADTDAITSTCCVVPDVKGKINRYFVVTSREEWPDHFLTWLHSTKDDEFDMNMEEEAENEEDISQMKESSDEMEESD